MNTPLIDDEVRALALLALKNAFYAEFSGLANKYIAAADGLVDTTPFEYMLQDMTSVFGRDTDARPLSLHLTAIDARGMPWKSKRLVDALEMGDAQCVHLEHRKVFEKRMSGWYYVGDKA